MEKFQDLKIDARSFNNFYLEFIHLALELEYIFEMFVQEFKYKLTSCLQDQLNSRNEFRPLISA